MIRPTLYRQFIKRWIDVVVAAAALVLLWPLFVMVAALVRLALGSPVLFRQTRPGLQGQPFVLVKFRSMTDGGPSPSVASDAARLIRVGHLLRRTSLDELPEFWNVLIGEMSLVGPRPLLMQYLPRYSERQRRRHDVRPGLTGLAQVSGRNSLSWPERLELDVQYTEQLSFWLDLRILLRTIRQVLSSKGVSRDGFATVDEFAGQRE